MIPTKNDVNLTKRSESAVAPRDPDYLFSVESWSIACAAESGGEPAFEGLEPSVGIPSADGAIVSTESIFDSGLDCAEFSREEQATARLAPTTNANIFKELFIVI